MADHHDLVAEMLLLEQMGTQERQKLAKKRRLQQLKKWSQREKELIAKEKQFNKRLANLIQEENNGLNLKQYTTYNNSNPRPTSKSKQQQFYSDQSTTNNNNNGVNNNNYNSIKTKSLDTQPNGKTTDHHQTLNNHFKPNSKVQFNDGVMLLEAAARNDYDEVKRLLMLGVSPNSVNHDGLTALHQCCIDSSEPIMLLLLKFNANVDARDTEQWTPLHAACTCGHLNLVKILVEHGADLLAVNGDGNMPFDICEDETTLSYIESQMVAKGITQEEIDLKRASNEMKMLQDIEKLIENYDRQEEREKIKTVLERPINDNDNNVTLLHIASANGYLSCVKFLLSFNVNVSACDIDLWQPIHGVACWGNNESHSKVLELLVKSGARLDCKTINDETVFDLCDNEEIIEKLNEIKEDIEKQRIKANDELLDDDDDSNRLKRTQSRSNSRIHSVRRTSVRDKNQISRREAREEALLRVESSNNNNTSTEPGQETSYTVNNVAQLAESTQNNSSSSSSDQLFESQACSIKTPDSPSKKPDKKGFEATRNASDELKSPCKQTDLDVVDNSIADSTDDKTANSDDEKLATKSALSNAKENHGRSESSTMEVSSTTNTKSLEEKFQTATNKTACDSTKKTTTTRSKEIGNKISIETNEFVGHKLIQSAKPVRQQQQLVEESHLVPLAPINYTLSNLKKQRSDLRMRTTSIGGGGSTTKSASAVTLSNIDSSKQHYSNNSRRVELDQQVVLLDPQPSSLTLTNLSNGTKHNSSSNHRQMADAVDGQTNISLSSRRPESPSLSFKKFSGEASETIEYRSKTKHKLCCILI